MSKCIICNKIATSYIKRKDGRILCKKCLNGFPAPFREDINDYSVSTLKELRYNFIRPGTFDTPTDIRSYNSVFLDNDNGRLYTSDSWIRTAGIDSIDFAFFPINETKDMLTGRVALIVRLRELPFVFSQEIDPITIEKENYLKKEFPWSAFERCVNKSIAINRDKFSFRRFYNTEEEKAKQDRRESQKQEEKRKQEERERQQRRRRSGTSGSHVDALAFFGLSEDYTMQELRAARNKIQKNVHPDNNGDCKDFTNKEELSKLTNQYFDILKQRLKRDV